MYHVVATQTFLDDMKKLDKEIARRVLEKIEFLASSEKPPGELLTNLPLSLRGLRKYRIGKWRLIFWVHEKKKEIALYGIELRSSVYQRMR